jgi:hypothetical protein
MSDLWVAVSCGYGDAVFSHRATGPDTAFAVRGRALRTFNSLLDESANCVRSGLAGWLGPQTPNPRPDAPLSEHEKLSEIRRIVSVPRFPQDADDQIAKIEAVLDR